MGGASNAAQRFSGFAHEGLPIGGAYLQDEETHQRGVDWLLVGVLHGRKRQYPGRSGVCARKSCYAEESKTLGLIDCAQGQAHRLTHAP